MDAGNTLDQRLPAYASEPPREPKATAPGTAADTRLPEYLTIEAAAARLSTSAHALRARCRRLARREGRDVVARLGGGIVAVKLGVSWRLRFPE